MDGMFTRTAGANASVSTGCSDVSGDLVNPRREGSLEMREMGEMRERGREGERERERERGEERCDSADDQTGDEMERSSSVNSRMATRELGAQLGERAFSNESAFSDSEGSGEELPTQLAMPKSKPEWGKRKG